MIGQLKKILTASHQPSKNECQDHLGNTYSSIREMCDKYNVPYHTFISRVASYGWSVEQALTEPLKDNTCKDHLGKEHSSITSMCKYWNVELPTYIQRLNRGCDIETALTSDTRISFLEDAVRAYLLSKNMVYKREHTFSDCRFEESGWLAYFDFYIPEIGIIEVDGKQHFEEVSIFGGLENFQKTQKHDAIKTTYCEEHNIPLLRIKYDQLKNDVYKDMIDNFLANPKDYINKHNMYLDNIEYYKVS